MIKSAETSSPFHTRFELAYGGSGAHGELSSAFPQSPARPRGAPWGRRQLSIWPIDGDLLRIHLRLNPHVNPIGRRSRKELTRPPRGRPHPASNGASKAVEKQLNDCRLRRACFAVHVVAPKPLFRCERALRRLVGGCRAWRLPMQVAARWPKLCAALRHPVSSGFALLVLLRCLRSCSSRNQPTAPQSNVHRVPSPDSYCHRSPCPGLAPVTPSPIHKGD